MSNLLSHTQATQSESDGLLDGRYQILQILSCGLWGQTYLAQDSRRPSQPECIIHRITPLDVHPDYQATFRHLFVREAATLEKLGEHPQIPQLLACFENEQGFHLIQEFVDGYPLSYEINPRQPWSVEQVIQLLIECLEPLAFVHQHCCRHGDLRPDTIVRRIDNNQLVLTNFGSVKEIHLSLMTLNGCSSQPIVTNEHGYQPPEQSYGLPCLASDVYALGMIGIQVLTGSHPSQFQRDPKSGELVWEPYCRYSDSEQLHDLIVVLNQMTRYDCTQRYLSAKETLQALQLISHDGAGPDAVTNSAPVAVPDSFEVPDSLPSSLLSESPLPDPLLPDPLLDNSLQPFLDDTLSNDVDWDSFFQQDGSQPHGLEQDSSQQDDSQPSSVDLSPPVSAVDLNPPVPVVDLHPPTQPAEQKFAEQNSLVKASAAEAPESDQPDQPTSGFLTSPAVQLGIGLGAVVATAICGYTLPHLLEHADRGTQTLAKATAQYQAGQLKEALNLAESIPKNSPAYAPARSTITRWQKDWQTAEVKYRSVEAAFKQGKWREVLQQAQGLPKITYWQQRVAPLVLQAKTRADVEANGLLQHAYSRAIDRDFTTALVDLKRIPAGTSVYTKAQEKTKEYSEKQKVRAVSLLQEAYDRAIVQDFDGALAYLKQIAKDTPTYAKAQEKIKEYTQKQRLLLGNSQPANPSKRTALSTSTVSATSTVVSIAQDINPGSYLREVSLS